MIVGGLQKISLLDYPGYISAIIFTQGCNFRCPFCYNPMLVEPAGSGKSKYLEKIKQKDYPTIEEDNLFAFLKKRQGKLDAVVITGGEPTIHRDLPNFLNKIKKLDYKIKLDTNGTNPLLLQQLIKKKLVDYIAMDIKSSFDNYHKAAGVKTDLVKIAKSVKIIKESKLSYEFRTTLVPMVVKKENIKKISELLIGVKIWYLQRMQTNTDLLDKRIKEIRPYVEKEMEELLKIAKINVKNCFLR